MKILFGMTLDSTSYPSLIVGRQAILGEMRCGPQGLIQVLETRLGLSGVWDPEPYRVEIYRQRLLAADNGRRFFSRSLMTDPQAVARTLLGWRDELVFCGWDFSISGSLSPRLLDFADVEALPEEAVRQVPWGFAERFRKIVSVLPSKELEISEIRVADELGHLSRPWNLLLEKLACSGIIVTEGEKIRAEASGDLGMIQKALASCSGVTATGDGSFVVLKTSSDSEVADLLASMIKSTDCHKGLFIIPLGDRALDRVLRASGEPSLGSVSHSPHRPILQILPLLCELLWEPLDPFRLLEFLTLPAIPLPRRVARRLADAVAAAPGIGGKAWHDALSSLESDYLADPGKGKASWEFVRKSIDDWLGKTRYPLAEGVPKGAVVELARRIAHWAGGRDGENLPQFKALAAQAGDLSKLAETMPEEFISQTQLRKLLRMVLGNGLSCGDIPEAGHLPWIASPESITSSVEEIFWWGFTNNHSAGYIRPPWLKGDVACLASAGVALLDPAVELQRQLSGSERAVYAAVKRLVLVVPERDSGTEVSPHPLYDRLSIILNKSMHRVEMTASQWMQGGNLLPALDTSPVTPRKIPKPERFWKIPRDVNIPKRDKESYSSLELLFGSPFSWVLTYAGKLREGALQSIGSHQAIMGNLAHRLFEELFKPGENCMGWIQHETYENVDRLLSHLLAVEGCVFLLPAHVSEQNVIRRLLKRAAWVMAGHILDNNWKVKGMECQASGVLGDQAVTGNVDLILEKPDGSLAVVDLKWGKSRHLRDKFLNNRACQLALYSHMLKVKSGNLPHVAYFSFSEAILVAPDRKAFKAARLAEIPEGESLASLIARMEATFKYRRKQLDEGLVEVPVTGTEADPSNIIPTDVLVYEDPVKPAGFKALVGWEEGNRA